MEIQQSKAGPDKISIKTISIALESGVLVARRNDASGHEHTNENFKKLDLSWFSGISDNMSKTVVGAALLDYILDWVTSETVEELSDTFNVEGEKDAVSDDMS